MTTEPPDDDDLSGDDRTDDPEEGPTDLAQDYAGGRPVGHHPSPEREDDQRGHSREAQPYDEAPAEGHLAPDTDWEDLPPAG